MHIYPKDFLFKIEEILGNDFQNFINESKKPAYRGIRINTLKCSTARFKLLCDYSLKEVPFCKDGFYLPEEISSPGHMPLHHAGAFYVQEPSAMSAVTLLNVKPGDKVLDLCSAPGGKSTQIASGLCGEGLLWANEAVRSRASILLSNIERSGISNAVVSSAYPDVLCNELKGFFDKVLVDAPCSGEGMFRKDVKAIEQWSVEHVLSCAKRQLSILESAKLALKVGGTLVYSTCTFSREENEDVIEKFLDNNKNFVLDEIDEPFGRRTGSGMVRVFPMDGGEGHFCARLKKISGDESGVYDYFSPDYKRNTDYISAEKFYDDTFPSLPFKNKIYIKNNMIYVLPKFMPLIKGNVGIIRSGILLGEFKKQRIEPTHCAFMAANKKDCRQSIDLALNSHEIKAFLRGEELSVPDIEDGYTCVCVESVSTGYGKCSGGRLKNKYPKGLRNNV